MDDADLFRRMLALQEVTDTPEKEHVFHAT